MIAEAKADSVDVDNLAAAKTRKAVVVTLNAAVDDMTLPNVLTTDAVNERLEVAARAVAKTLVTDDATDKLTLDAVSFAQFRVAEAVRDRLTLA
jgi:hypothetical protein